MQNLESSRRAPGRRGPHEMHCCYDGKRMSPDVIATVLTGVGVLVGVWRMVESVRRDVDGVRRDVDGVRRDLTAQIAAVNTRIDNILLADLGRKSP